MSNKLLYASPVKRLSKIILLSKQKSSRIGNNIDVCSIEGKQSDLCKGNIIFCHVDCFCLQEREDEVRSIFCFQHFGDRLSKHNKTGEGLPCNDR